MRLTRNLTICTCRRSLKCAGGWRCPGPDRKSVGYGVTGVQTCALPISVTEKFEFIDAEYAAYQESDDMYVPSIVKMCRWMEVSRSGFYGWRNAPESATAKRRGELALIVRKSFDESDGTYGYRRVHTDLVAWGVPAGPELVRSVMRELGLEACQPRPWRFSLTEGDGQEHDIPGLVSRDFTADAPGVKMVGDITYIPISPGALAPL